MSLSIPGHCSLAAAMLHPHSAARSLASFSYECLNFYSKPSTQTLRRSSFFGDFCSSSSNKAFIVSIATLKQRRHHVVTARIKRRKDPTFDKVIEREKKLRIVSKLKDLLVKQPGRVMSLRTLGKYRGQIGLMGKRRFVVLLRKYPAVFKVFEEGAGSIYFRLTHEAEAQYFEELKIKEELEDLLVIKLRKLLMMSVDRRILISKIKHIKRDLGLPDDFDTELVKRYPQFFTVVDTGMGPALELALWDPALAVTAAEKKAQQEVKQDEPVEEASISGRSPKFPRLPLPRGYTLSRKDRENILKFHQLPCISPYEDKTQLDPASPEAEKHAVKVVQELLSLTIEKRTLVDHLTHFRRDYKFSQRIRSMLIRHPEIFYVSFKGHRDSVFLTEAYKGSELKEKDPLVLAKERLGALVALGRKGQRLDESEGDEESDDDEEDVREDYDWSDADDEVLDATKVKPTSGSAGVLDEDEEDKMRVRILREAERASKGPRRDLEYASSRPREKW
ncbi:hypothetical protein O6H91_18G065300 [Diphasiastrum complanatum]|uniref:Uncharacterized protein n=3 Tax=Diphasiastrum complanatum TaxID=34168 RepID=A0ACC2B291_DIPCM|nr:hypothetical protein O6H91_Y101500 [Diphasiastrum complanatum]KAJ7299991.1 hypothetical protein O6H91_Y101500 [Diphasiastrum complanatum]KAJ7299992.1 hypothetical protein O6H91_Y101500 [Diphasiastrum complanatum]KAJ7299993.1 hypothetical protein O6H91_Y101500 [Diphasiastrum complanatum]KAJ7523855.1 hypothetical protein O6H91_18G065300 [Diphasiastrum complanatum]